MVLLGSLFAAIVASALLVPKIIVPYIDQFKEKGYRTEGETRGFEKIISQAVRETIFSTLIHSLDIIYRSWAVIANLYKQITGNEFVWITGASGEAETFRISLTKTYQILWAAPVLGGILFVASWSDFFPSGLILVLSPYILSFLLGPLAVWHTSNPLEAK